MTLNTTLLPAVTPFVALRRDFERQLGLESGFLPGAMTIVESPEEFVVQLDLPGVEQSDVDITIHNDQLVIQGQRRRSEVENGRRTYCDRSFEAFRRILKLRQPIEREQIEAELRDGVLHVRLPRTPESKPRQIPIRVA